MSTVQFVRAVYKCLLRHSSTSIVHLLVRGDSKGAGSAAAVLAPCEVHDVDDIT